MREMKIHARHEYVTRSANTANVRSKVLAIKPPNGTFLVVRRILEAVIKLYKSGGSQLDPNTKVYIGKQRPGDASPTYAPGVFTLQSFYDLTSAQQRSSDNRATLAQDLGAGIALREQETLLIELEGPDVVNWANAASTFEFPVNWSAS